MKSVTVWMCISSFLLLLGEAASSWDGPSAVSVSLATGSPGSPGTGSGPGAQTEWVDCIQASDWCNQNPHCSSRYRVMRQCLVGKEKEAMLDNNRECQAALEVLLVSPLYDCRCRRGMKKELQCLQNYWTIHMGLTEGYPANMSPHHANTAGWPLMLYGKLDESDSISTDSSHAIFGNSESKVSATFCYQLSLRSNRRGSAEDLRLCSRLLRLC
ncbi:hypothetical protein FQN60_017841 [Etheostoma spectabile]|uniref:GDNF/GAS1 domain-containing protein n=1 Tax=Etheostoma spectabile TaxID=54343 RepID=A0A5J5DGA1_9PERO|nr:hypothetical protein FQN60_017841 [Etheostoma spectabile]